MAKKRKKKKKDGVTTRHYQKIRAATIVNLKLKYPKFNKTLDYGGTFSYGFMNMA